MNPKSVALLSGLSIVLLLSFTGAALHTAFAQSRLLDDFEKLEGWRAITSDGAKLTISGGDGHPGKAMLMDFSLAGGYGYVIARKAFAIDIPGDYQFTFDLRGELSVNNFEFKLVDSVENVYWIKKLNVEYPSDWKKQRIRKRQISFAWGPDVGKELTRVKEIEFVVSTGNGGAGKVWIDNFRFEPIVDESASAKRATVEASSVAKGTRPELSAAGDTLRGWRSGVSRREQSLVLHFNRWKEIGGLVLDWDSSAYATSYSVELSDDGKEWSEYYRVREGNGGRAYIPTPEAEGKHLRLRFVASRGNALRLRRMVVRGFEFSATPNDLFAALSREHPKGTYPKYFTGEQSYWTVFGAASDRKEALINQQGMIETESQGFSLEPFLFSDRRLITWNDVTTSQSLEKDYLPIPIVEWNYDNRLGLRIKGFASGDTGKSVLYAEFAVTNLTKAPQKGTLFVALRPFQVNPTSQTLNTVGGATHIDSIRYSDGIISINRKEVLPLETPSSVGATGFDGGDITEYLRQGIVPQSHEVHDPTRFASAAMSYAFDLSPGASATYHLAIPFYERASSLKPNMDHAAAATHVADQLAATVSFWESKLDRFRITLPKEAQPIINTIKSNLAYIFINRDGPGIQPGSRSYDRSWIRDGSLTSTALLETGITDEVRDFIDWYARYQYPDGKIPCVVDWRGADAVPENDSHGEFIYAVMQYFAYTHDTTWLAGKWEQVKKTVDYIRALRSRRKTDKYINGTPTERACYGLLVESISHEGYWSRPMHSYWDDFFALRGLKDAAHIAAILHKTDFAQSFAAERDDFRKDLYNSMRLAMKNTGIDYIPGCAELGDFDATSTTIGVIPGGELGQIPEPALHNTFAKYYQFTEDRKADKIEWDRYTPYELRTVGTFVYLDQKSRAHALLDFFMHDRRPPGWNDWGEVVWKDPTSLKFIGDMPHTWVGSDFIRSVRSMFVYERESDSALVIGAGIRESWLDDPQGVKVESLPTCYGPVSYLMKRSGDRVSVEMSGNPDLPPDRLVIKSPLERPLRSVSINGKSLDIKEKSEVRLPTFPATIFFEYGPK